VRFGWVRVLVMVIALSGDRVGRRLEGIRRGISSGTGEAWLGVPGPAGFL
jgi:hypothetical protein